MYAHTDFTGGLHSNYGPFVQLKIVPSLTGHSFLRVFLNHIMGAISREVSFYLILFLFCTKQFPTKVNSCGINCSKFRNLFVLLRTLFLGDICAQDWSVKARCLSDFVTTPPYNMTQHLLLNLIPIFSASVCFKLNVLQTFYLCPLVFNL